MMMMDEIYLLIGFFASCQNFQKQDSYQEAVEKINKLNDTLNVNGRVD